MRKNKRGRSRRGGYWFYPSPGDDEHAFTKLRNKLSSGSWKFWQKQPEEASVMPVSSDYQPNAEQPAPVMAEEAQMPEQAQGSLEYPSPEPQPMDNTEAPMEPTPPMDNEQAPMEENPPMDNQEAPVEPNPETSETQPAITGGRRRRRSRTTKKRKRSNMRRRTNKRRRSNKRRR